MATAGMIGNWNIDNIGLVNDSTSDVYLKTIKRDSSGNVVASAYVGTDGTGYAIGAAVASFLACKSGLDINTALYAKAIGSTSSLGDIAAHLVGQLLVEDGGIQILKHVGPSGTILYQGKTSSPEYERNGHVYKMQFIDGIFIGEVLVEE